MALDLSRRQFIKRAAIVAFAAPAIVRASSLMSVKPLPKLFIYESTAYGNMYEELTAVTRKAFIPRAYIQFLDGGGARVSGLSFKGTPLYFDVPGKSKLVTQ